MSRKKRLALAAVTAALIIVPALPGGADTTPPSITGLSATASNGVLTVTGTGTFPDATTQVGEDGTGDVAAKGLGMDISTLSIGRVNAVKNGNIVFTMGIADQPAVLMGTPEAVAWGWDINVTTAGETKEYTLYAWRMASALNPAKTDASFQIWSCGPVDPQTNSRTCDNKNTNGTLGDGFVQWSVTPSSIGAANGSVIEDLDGAQTVLSTAGEFNGFIGYDSANMDGPYTLGPTVTLSLKNAAGSEVRTGSATIAKTTGAITGSLSVAGLPAGSYTLTATSCNGIVPDSGNGSCADTSIPVTL